MNLREFLDYRNNCPSCGSTLNTIFHSHKRQKHLYLNNRFIAIFNMNSFNSVKRGQNSYKVGYSIGMEDNSLAIEFFDVWGERRFEDQSPLWLIEKFKIFNKNQGDYKLNKHCNICSSYNYSSSPFPIHYRDSNIGELTVNSECFSLKKEIEDGYKIYRIINYYNLSETWLDATKSPLEYMLYDHQGWEMKNPIKTGLISYDLSSENLLDRIEKLLPFY